MDRTVLNLETRGLRGDRSHSEPLYLESSQWLACCQPEDVFQTSAQAWAFSRDLACVLFSTSHLSLPCPLLPPVNSPAHTTLVPILMFPTFVESLNDFLVSYSNKTPQTSFPCTVCYQPLADISVLINGWRKICLPSGEKKTQMAK